MTSATPLTPSTTSVEQPLASIWVEGRPVSANAMYRVAGPRQASQAGHASPSGKRRLYLTDQAAAWEMSVIADAVTQAAPRELAHATGLRIACTFFGVRGDADNYLKATLDGLKRALKIDDREFQEVSASRSPGKRQAPGAHIAIYGVLPVATAKPAPESSPAPAHAAHAPQAAQAAQHAPGSLRVHDLVDEKTLDHLHAPVQVVTIWPAPMYGALIIMFPPSPELETNEWGAFISMAQARELRDRLNEMLTDGGLGPQEVAS